LPLPDLTQSLNYNTDLVLDLGVNKRGAGNKENQPEVSGSGKSSRTSPQSVEHHTRSKDYLFPAQDDALLSGDEPMPLFKKTTAELNPKKYHSR
jgi:hypothetical protein